MGAAECVQIGPCQLWLGDCRAVMVSLQEEGAELHALVTDPPYGIDKGSSTIGKRGRASRVTWPDTRLDVRQVYAPAVRNALRLTNGRGIVTPGAPNAFEYPKPKDIGCIYQPCSPGCSSWGRATAQPVLFYGKDPRAGKHLDPITFTQNQPAEEVNHPTPKPLKVGRWMVRRASLPGETVFDPFMGSGTFGVAAILEGRRFVGIEVDADYFATACKRIREAVNAERSSLFPAGEGAA